MQRVVKASATLIFAFGVLAAPAAFAFGGHGGGGHGGFGGGGFHGGGGWHGGGWHGGGFYGGGGWGGWGWGYPYYGYGYDYGYPYDYGYDYSYGYPPPQVPTYSPYCATQTRVCVLRHSHNVGTSCSCKGARGEISAIPQQ
jgi:hypothetical protein